jgi:ParB/RepB/Spo0J family partition protein
MEPDISDREESLKADWDEFLESIRATAKISQQGAGNHTAVIVVGVQAPFEIVAGRRRWLACKELNLPVEVKLYPYLNDDEKAHLRYSENFQRNNYTPYETVANVLKELERGKTREWLSAAFGKSIRSIDTYITIAKDLQLIEEVRRGLSLREAFRLKQDFGKDAATEAAKLRQAEGAPVNENHTSTQSRHKDEGGPRALFVTKVLPGTRVLLRFNEEKAGPQDFHAYSKWLDAERERIGTLIGARTRRAQA